MNMNAQSGNDRVRARRALEDAFVRQNALLSCVASPDADLNFCRDPAQYEWRYIEKREMLVPYNCPSRVYVPQDAGETKPSGTKAMRWEKHRVWIVEGTLCRGESNVLQRRRFYIEEDSWFVLLGEGYDFSGRLVTHYLLDSYAVSLRSSAGRWYSI
jgi:hypothetical protein